MLVYNYSVPYLFHSVLQSTHQDTDMYRHRQNPDIYHHSYRGCLYKHQHLCEQNIITTTIHIPTPPTSTISTNTPLYYCLHHHYYYLHFQYYCLHTRRIMFTHLLLISHPHVHHYCLYHTITVFLHHCDCDISITHTLTVASSSDALFDFILFVVNITSLFL